MRVVFNGRVFLCRCAFTERDVLRKAGFNWSREKCVWYTYNHNVAARLREHCDETAKKELNRILLTVTPWAGAISYPKDLKPYDFQRQGVAFALERNRSYLAFDPGLGKTPISAMILNATKEKAVFICPPFLMNNVKAELYKWCTYGPVIQTLGEYGLHFPDVLIIPDSILHRASTIGKITEFVEWWREQGVKLFVDEAHRYKNPDAKRTRTLFGYSRKDRRDSNSGLTSLFNTVTFLSGTPMPNRPMELFPVLSACAPETIDFMNKFDFGRRYCAGHRTEFGWDFSGASNIKELASNVIGKFMMRVKKSEVLTELPPKTEELVFIDEDLPPKIADMDRSLLEIISPEDLMEGKIATQIGTDGELHMATYRRELGLSKVIPSLKFIKSILEDSDESVLVFAHHKEVIERLTFGFEEYNPIVITGKTPSEDRQSLVNEFQTNKDRRVFIGNIIACGVGFTLTKATRVCFVEFSWTPAENDQASDRAHRIGQRDNVFVQYFCYNNSIDRKVMETVFRKRNITRHI